MNPKENPPQKAENSPAKLAANPEHFHPNSSFGIPNRRLLHSTISLECLFLRPKRFSLANKHRLKNFFLFFRLTKIGKEDLLMTLFVLRNGIPAKVF